MALCDDMLTNLVCVFFLVLLRAAIYTELILACETSACDPMGNSCFLLTSEKSGLCFLKNFF